MAIPCKVTGAGPVKATECFKVTFSQALSTAPIIEAYDNSSSYPAVDASGMTTAKEIFTGTTINTSIPMLAAWSGGAEADGNLPASASWHPAAATAGSANPNLLKGATNYVTCTNTPGAAGNIVFNLSLKVPSDATVPGTVGMSHLVQIRYTYTGTAPALAFYCNEGTEAVPSWTQLTPGTHGIQFVNASTSSGTYDLTLPGTGETKVAPELWVT
jgi:hypothetical protein